MSGQSLARRFYDQIVAPRLRGIPHSAALLGDGSEVLGFDDEVSTDHDFGPRVQVFPADIRDLPAALAAVANLPERFEEFPLAHTGRQAVTVTTIEEFFVARIGVDPHAGMTLHDWLTTPTQRLATLVGGAVFQDPDGSLAARRRVLAWYPDDVWRYVLAAGWLRVAQEEAFIARTGSVGDDLGSALVTARVARDLIRLAFLIERTWAPYSKWLGSAFARLGLAAVIGPTLQQALDARSWRERETALCTTQRQLATATNALSLAEEVDPEPRQFYDRDIQVMSGERFTTALTSGITDPELRSLIERLGRRENGPVLQLPGAIDQAIDSVDILTHPDRCRAAAPALGLGLG